MTSGRVFGHLALEEQLGEVLEALGARRHRAGLRGDLPAQVGEHRRCHAQHLPQRRGNSLGEREFFIDNLLIRIHSIIVMLLVDRPCAMGVCATGEVMP